MEVKLTRKWWADHWTGGLLYVPGIVPGPLFTMEPGPDKRIPEGKFHVFRRDPLKYKGAHYPDAFEIVVPGRVAVLFHQGAVPSHTKACIMPGFGLNVFTITLERSSTAMTAFYTALEGINEFTLIVRDT